MNTKLGATFLGLNRCRFIVWAPFARQVNVHIVYPENRSEALKKNADGYHSGIIDGTGPGTRYFYQLDDGGPWPDPASRYQPEGVHGPSEIIPSVFSWNDSHWSGICLSRYILYELHVGTFTPEGTFGAVIPWLDTLKDLGITAIELMPVAQFPGDRNWGYDPAYPFAIQHSYGGPTGLKNLVNACHRKGLAVVLDVVYNHLGPEGNYFSKFGPYFTDVYSTPWGPAMNFDDRGNDHVRRFFIENAIYWIHDCHIDALRIDAVHAIMDFSARPFLLELSETVHRLSESLNRRVYTIAESDLNDTKIVRPEYLGGYDLDAQWNEDFHHSVHSLVTGEKTGYFQDFGTLDHLAKACREGFVYSGQYSFYRNRRHGNSSRQLTADRLIVFIQNHDQVGNRMMGERLSAQVSFEVLKLSAALALLSPFIPLLFMGEEYGEPAPFQYFISHSDPALIEAVRKGREKEFAAFQWQGVPPDPQDISTFLQCKLNHGLRHQGHHRVLFEFYRYLIHLRKTIPALACLNKDQMTVTANENRHTLTVHRWNGSSHALLLYHFNSEPAEFEIRGIPGQWDKRLDSTELQWNGPGSTIPPQILSEGLITLTSAPHAVLLFTLDNELANQIHTGEIQTGETQTEER
ncbi:MAG: malto-oligosyltrehalose trehalohydrolase [Desulfobacterales bacterium]|nr:malto-oligosyltrehalose trehalohydrolase [Desulfobacterales bacterium]MDD4073380.1 malto-oligosyltrehalose trehalohydrolase [Desulfobacterales bacterium]MDD4391949.1 malto-oligosyltrehalose trehalohydrolase [Desulfobacterales bacterium]